MRSQPGASKAAPRATLASFFRREFLTLAGIAGAALTLLSLVAWYIPLSPFFLGLISKWMVWAGGFVLPLLQSFGLGFAPALQAAVQLALAFVLIAVGAAVAGDRQDVADRGRGALKNATFLSFAVLIASLALVHFTSSWTTGGWNEDQEKPIFAIVIGYFAGDIIGRRGFHKRLSWLAIATMGLMAANWALVPTL